MSLSRLLPLVFLVASPLAAATFHVTTTADAPDAAPGNGTCATAAAACSLRAAVQEANARPGADFIVLPAGTFTLAVAGAGEEQAATGDLDVRDALTITGQGPAVTTIDAAGLDRHFDLFASFSLRGVVLRGGNAGAANGGALRLNAIATESTLELNDVTLTGNTAANGGALSAPAGETDTFIRVSRAHFEGNSATGSGGAVYTAGHLREALVTFSRFVNNTAAVSGGALYVRDGRHYTRVLSTTFDANGTPGNGGAIAAEHAQTLQTTYSTFVRNTAARGGAIYTCCVSGNVGQVPTPANDVSSSLSTFSANRATVSGGAIDAAGSFHATGVTMAANSAPVGAAIFAVASGTPVSIRNSILASDGPNCGGVQPTGAYNVVDDSTCGGLTAAEGNLLNADPMLGPLADNGGPTQTHHPLPGSPVVDRAPDGTGFDQRGARRPFGAGYDVGSVEVTTAARAATTTSITAYPNPVLAGEPVTLTASAVASAQPNLQPPGLIIFRSGATEIGRIAQDFRPGALVLTDLPPGTHAITATFDGNYGFAPSVSEPILIVVAESAHHLSIPALDAVSLGLLALLLAAAGVIIIRH